MFFQRCVFILVSIFILTGCKKVKKTSKQDEKSVEMALYTSETFTEPGEFPSGIEGPAADVNGNLYVVNYKKTGTIGRVDPEGRSSLFVTLPEGSIANGIRFNSKGLMLVADYTKHNILKIDPTTKEISVFGHNDKMNQPNDIAISDNDLLFASDPDWKNSKGQIWRIDTLGNFTLLEDNMGTTNGIEVSPDNKTLYVNESEQLKVWAYDLSAEGEISNKRLLIEFEDYGMDGMRTDIKGNLYIARYGKGTVVKVSPEGDILREVSLKGKSPSNVVFGGKRGDILHVTLQDNGNIERFRVEDPGREFQMAQKRVAKER